MEQLLLFEPDVLDRAPTRLGPPRIERSRETELQRSSEHQEEPPTLYCGELLPFWE